MPVQPSSNTKLFTELQRKLKLYKYPKWVELKQKQPIKLSFFLNLLGWIAGKFPSYMVDGLEKQLVSDEPLSTAHRLLRRLWIIFRCHFGLQAPFDEAYFLNEATNEERCIFILQIIDFMEEYDLLGDDNLEMTNTSQRNSYDKGLLGARLEEETHESYLSSPKHPPKRNESPITNYTKVFYRNLASLFSSQVHSMDEEPKPHTPLEVHQASTSFASSVTFSSPPETCMMNETRLENLLGKMLSPIEQDIHRLSDRLGRVELQMDRMELQIDHLVSQMRKQQALKDRKSEEQYQPACEESFHSYEQETYAKEYEDSMVNDEYLEEHEAALENIPSLENPLQTHPSDMSMDNRINSIGDKRYDSPTGTHDNLEDFLRILREKMNNARDILQRATERNAGY